MPHTYTCFKQWNDIHEEWLRNYSYSTMWVSLNASCMLNSSGMNRTSSEALLICPCVQKTFVIAHTPVNLPETENLQFLALSLMLSAALSTCPLQMCYISDHSRQKNWSWTKAAPASASQYFKICKIVCVSAQNVSQFGFITQPIYKHAQLSLLGLNFVSLVTPLPNEFFKSFRIYLGM